MKFVELIQEGDGRPDVKKKTDLQSTNRITPRKYELLIKKKENDENSKGEVETYSCKVDASQTLRGTQIG